jgi:TPR repeat protein
MGNRYASGQTVPKDEPLAASWYRKAAEQGDANAQYLLARMYFEGRGVAQDDAEAARWYRKAAEQNNADAEYALGLMYDNGRGTEKDGAKAVELYQKAAAQGSGDAKDRLAERATILAQLRSTRELIATRVETLLTESDRVKVEESAARLAAANDRTALVDLKALQVEANDVLGIFGDAKEFARVSEISAKRIAVIEGELKQITSDAPVVLRVQAAIDAVKAASAGSDLRILQSSLGELNGVFDRNRSELDKLKFYHP